MKPIKIVHFADIHLGMENYGKIDPATGLNTRLADFTKSLDEIVDFSLKEKIDLVVFAGDAYKTREPSPTFQREFAKRIYRLAAADIPVVMVVGNHDFPNALGKADTLEIFPTLAVPNIHIFKKEELQIISTPAGPIQVAGLPWLVRSHVLSKTEMAQKNFDDLNNLAAKRVKEKIIYLSSLIKKEIPSIFVGHASIEKAVYGAERQVTIGSEIVIPLSAFFKTKFNAILMGHLHKHQEIPLSKTGPPIIYSGSIERVDFGEEKEAKGFVLLELSPKDGSFKSKIFFKKLISRPFISIRTRIETTDNNPTQKIIQQIKKHQLKEAVVRVIIEVPEEKSLEIREGAIREALKEVSFIAGIIKEIQKGNRLKTEAGFSDELANLDALGLLEKYLRLQKKTRLRIEILKKETEKLLEEEMFR